MKNKKSFVLVFCALSLAQINAFDWPQESRAENISTYFAEPRGDAFCAGLLFSDAGAQVRASDKGTVLVSIEPSKSISMFDSPLGNALVVQNNDELLCTYGNLSNLYITSSVGNITEKTIIGISGKSGFAREQNAGLEFQLADLKSKTLINPQILLPQDKKNNVVNLRNITAVNKNGTEYQLSLSKVLPAGTYSLYTERTSSFVPYRISVLLNGKEIETITYDMLKKSGNRLLVNGIKKYSFDAVFPKESRQLLADISLNRGKAVIVVQTFSIGAEERNYTYTLDIY